MGLIKREECYTNRYGQYECYNSAWDNWVRWLVLALVILGALFIFFLFSCITARRRRRHGAQPYRGTGWALGRTPPGHAPAQYTQQHSNHNAQPYYNNSNNPPPAYGTATDYYGGNRNDVELQQPTPAYAPPKGPPPGHVA